MKEAVYGVAPSRRAPGLEFAESLVQRRITPRVRESFTEDCFLEIQFLDHCDLHPLNDLYACQCRLFRKETLVSPYCQETTSDPGSGRGV
jgi:hypothetical protein